MRRATECFSMNSLMSTRIRWSWLVEQELGQGLAQLRLAHAGGAQEEEASR
jgi:hypothetical protein